MSNLSFSEFSDLKHDTLVSEILLILVVQAFNQVF